MSIITTTGSLTAMSTTYGTASASQTFNTAGTDIVTGILVTPPTGFEVSLDDSTFAATVSVLGTGTIASTPVYIRLKAAQNAATYSGNVMLTSSGATTVNVATVASIIAKAMITITAENKTRVYGVANPTFTYLATGFVNGETSSVITTVPTLVSYTTVDSINGTYPIIPSGAAVTIPNYNFTYVNGVLTITAQTIEQLLALDTAAQYNVLKNLGVQESRSDEGYSKKLYTFTYQSTLFAVSVLYGEAETVLMNVESIT